MLETIKIVCQIVWFFLLIVIAFAIIYGIINNMIIEAKANKKQLEIRERLYYEIEKTIDKIKEDYEKEKEK